VGEPEHAEAGQVGCGGEQGEVGVDLWPPADAGAAAAVSAAHQVGDFALDLGTGGGVGGFPVGVGLAGAGAAELFLVGPTAIVRPLFEVVQRVAKGQP